MKERQRRIAVILLALVIMATGAVFEASQNSPDSSPEVQSANTTSGSPALDELSKLPIKGKAPKTGYKREQFSSGWGNAGDCDMRNYILKRDMTDVITRSVTDCTVMQGRLLDPYTSKTIVFVKGTDSSDDIHIDHVVALSDAWQTGAQQISAEQRYKFANDPLNLLAVDGPANQQKGDADVAAWLPANKDYRCQYVARRIAVKHKYSLWITQAGFEANKKVLASCPGQVLPVVN